MQWQFWIDRGGTFTDIIALSSQNEMVTKKLLSANPQQYSDPAIYGIREILQLGPKDKIPRENISVIKMGTTVATNALLERKGEPLVLVTNKGFKDVLRIGYQQRPDLFALKIELPEVLYDEVIEVDARVNAEGKELKSLVSDEVSKQLKKVYKQGYRALAIVFMHAYRFFEHEKQVAAIAKKIGFTEVSSSHEVMPLMKFISRGDTTLVNAYLSPILSRYIQKVKQAVGRADLFFMQSNGGLAKAGFFHGKNSILSGPAGGVVGMATTALAAGFDKVIGFDMGGTSTDVSHYAGAYEKTENTEIAGIRICSPMMLMHTIAAGGGSILHFDGARFTVGPDSAGANPGPACYQKGGPLTITDCNVLLGKLHPDFFPKIFGEDHQQSLDLQCVTEKFSKLTCNINQTTQKNLTPEQVAMGFLRVAVDNMANAIRKISIDRGYDIKKYIINCFGGAAGQHACLVADSLGIKKILIHPRAGVLSAYGIGVAPYQVILQQSVEKPLSHTTLSYIKKLVLNLEKKNKQNLLKQGAKSDKIQSIIQLKIKYQGSDTTLAIDYADLTAIKKSFFSKHRQQFGFALQDVSLVVESVFVETKAYSSFLFQGEKFKQASARKAKPIANIQIYGKNKWQNADVYDRRNLSPGQCIKAVAMIIDETTTTIVEPGWQVEVLKEHTLFLSRIEKIKTKKTVGTKVDPIMLEIFNNRFMAIAEQMGIVLKNTAHSVNIKERLDFSCALFNAQGDLVANAPHIPVHLGSMSQSVKAVLKDQRSHFNPGDVFMSNAPYNGGTHLPDVTLITPVFSPINKKLLFFVASRGHHADIGGITPGSMPAFSKNIDEEGVLIDNFKIVSKGKFLYDKVLKLLNENPYSARNSKQNIEDFKAQIAANETGKQALMVMINEFGLDVVKAYMQYVRDNAAFCVREVLAKLKSGSFSYEMDAGQKVQVKISIDNKNKQAVFDFSQTSRQQDNNFNAPVAVTKAAILYVLRCLIGKKIPLNEGCLEPIKIIIPENCMLNPKYPAAVVAGNVETSQCIVDTIFAALKVMAASQGTCNNLTFGNEKYQYYETICGGSGAGVNFSGQSAVQIHITNTRLTDPEVLEWRFPVILEGFSIRYGSAGTGKFSGGNGVIRKIRFLQPMQISILSSHRKIPPFGLAGGFPAKVGKNYIITKTGEIKPLQGCDEAFLQANEIIVIETPGGGGYGE